MLGRRPGDAPSKSTYHGTVGRAWLGFGFAVACAACFPAYEIAGGDASSGDAGPGDGSAGDGGGDSTTSSDSGVGADARQDAPHDARPPPSDAGGCNAPFPSTPILDTFAAPGPLGAPWIVQNAGAYVVDDAGALWVAGAAGAVVTAPGAVSWGTVFGGAEEAYFTVRALQEGDASLLQEVEILFEAQTAAMENNAVYVDYSANSGPLGFYVGYVHNGNFSLQGSTTYPGLHAGDVVGARLCSDGTVKTYVNGTEVDSYDVSPFSFRGTQGYVGIFTSEAVLPLGISAFGGGTLDGG